jgi:DNA-binding Lrp family transcriptional regulator
MGGGAAGLAPVALTPEEKRLLSVAQSHFPLVAEPYAALAAETGWTENGVRERFQAWLESGLVRRLGAIFDSWRLGYRGALLAAGVPAERVEEVAEEINAWPGVTHNYLRDDAGTGYNLWFTLTVGPERSLADEVGGLAARVRLGNLIILPATRLFKIKVEFPLEDAPQDAEPASRVLPSPADQLPAGYPPVGQPVPASLSEEEWRVVRAFTADLPLIPRPFRSLGRQAGVSEERALLILALLRRQGVIRRFGATLKHFVVGYPANALTVWRVTPADEERVGRVLAGSPRVSHCYARSTRPEWPYNLFAMLHAESRTALQEEAARLAAAAGLSGEDYRLLFTERELKKDRLWYGGERA